MKWSIWRDHGLPWPVRKMTKQQYIIIATHKLLDKLEADGKPYTRVSKNLDKEWMKQIKEAQGRFDKAANKKKKQDQEDNQKKLNDNISIEDQIVQDQKEMMKNIVWDKGKNDKDKNNQ